jgi:hypothetical protein
MKFLAKNKKGLTYTEILITLPIALLSIFSAVAAILGSIGFNETAKAYTLGMNFAAHRLEEIRKEATTDAITFRQKMLSYNNKRFPTYPPVYPNPSQQEDNTLRGLGLDPFRAEAMTRVTMLSTYDLADVTVVVCVKDKRDRVIGEDKNFNGVLDSGEDTNSNNVLDSPLTLHVLVARK